MKSQNETFLQYLTRPTGIGRTPWSQAIVISSIMFYGVTASIKTWNQGGWVGMLCLGIVAVGWVVSTWRNYKNLN